MKGNEFSYCIIIVTFNRLELLKECLEHAVNQTVSPRKVIVVDNCSTDGTKEYLNGYLQDSRFLIHFESENTGGAGGFYRGIKLARDLDVDWVMLIDDDAILDYNCMENMCPEPDSTAKAYACVVKCQGVIDTLHRRNKNSDISAEPYEQREFNCDFASFCGLMIQRKLIEQVGLPEKDYFIWFDDTEYCMRINKLTTICVRCQAELDHKTTMEKPRKGEAAVSWKQYYGMRNRIHAYIKHKYWKNLFRTVSILMLQIVYNTIKSIYAPEYRNKAVLLFDGLKDGLRCRLGKNPKYLPGVKK